jgi:hypothetical protein
MAFSAMNREEFTMTMSSETTTLYDVAKTKLTADARLEQAKTTLYRFGGMGVLAAMLGAGIGLACFGYSYVTDGRAQAQKMADAMVQALEKAQLTTTGDIKLADGSTVGLAPGGQVMLAPNSTVRVDPSSSVKLAGFIAPDTHSTTALPPVQAAPTPQNKVITQYTTFNTVSFDKGQVVTGWNFDNSNQINPAYQYCYYSERSDELVQVRTELGRNGARIENLNPRPGVDLIAAFNNCVWF